MYNNISDEKQKNKEYKKYSSDDESKNTYNSDISGSKKKSNLISFNKRSKDEARKFGKIGGIKSGEVRREKKTIKEKLELALEITSKRIMAQSDNEEDKKLLAEVGIDGLIFMQILISPDSSPETKLAALDKIHNRIHGKVRPEEITPKEMQLPPPIIHFMGVLPAPYVPRDIREKIKDEDDYE
jgi:hypothetical protein